ncbi:3-methyl-2-oxobutanoate hydroxymethyltransferase [Candidatus Omnitrophota bacterium]
MSDKITVEHIRSMKGQKKITALTAYDYSFAQLLDHGGVDIILVGDSLGMVVLGDDSTKNVTMDDMMRHTAAVRKGVTHALVVTDMPINTFNNPDDAVKNAKRLIDAGAEAVKIEGNGDLVPVIDAMRTQGIEVMGHVGLTPQTTTEFKVRGKNKDEAQRIYDDAKLVSRHDVFSLVLECIPSLLAQCITHDVSIPTIGIGAGAQVDGQILVMHDLLGLYANIRPKFVTQLADLSSLVKDSVKQFKSIVEQEKFPTKEQSFTMNKEDLPNREGTK